MIFLNLTGQLTLKVIKVSKKADLKSFLNYFLIIRKLQGFELVFDRKIILFCNYLSLTNRKIYF